MTPRDTERFADRTVGEIVVEDYRRAAVFERHGIDFCCGGGRTLKAACRERGIDPRTVEEELQDAGGSGGSDQAGPESGDLVELVRHIEDVHHRYVRESLPVLQRFSQKVARVHGGRRPELLDVEALVGELSEELLRHLEVEEKAVFPYIRSLIGDNGGGEVKGSNDGGREPGSSGGAWIAEMEHDHESAGQLMRSIRELSDGFDPPAGACSTYRALYAKLEEFEGDLHRHVHLETNALFPRAAALEEARAG